MEKTLKTMESRHSVKQRWKPGDQEFDKAVMLINKERRSDTLKALHVLSIERHFLLTLKKKYAGNFLFIFSFTWCTCYLFYTLAKAHMIQSSYSYLTLLFYRMFAMYIMFFRWTANCDPSVQTNN